MIAGPTWTLEGCTFSAAVNISSRRKKTALCPPAASRHVGLSKTRQPAYDRDLRSHL